MRISWWAFVVVGAVLLVVGAYTISASQSQMSYDKSCEKVVTCGTLINPRPEFFMSKSVAESMQQAELTWGLGAVAAGLGVVTIIYGAYLHPERRAPSPPVQAESAPKPTMS